MEFLLGVDSFDQFGRHGDGQIPSLEVLRWQCFSGPYRHRLGGRAPLFGAFLAHSIGLVRLRNQSEQLFSFERTELPFAKSIPRPYYVPPSLGLDFLIGKGILGEVEREGNTAEGQTDPSLSEKCDTLVLIRRALASFDLESLDSAEFALVVCDNCVSSGQVDVVESAPWRG